MAITTVGTPTQSWLVWAWTISVGWIKEMTRGEKALLLAVLFLGGVGAYGTHEFFSISRGQIVGWFAALGVELMYLGSAGVAVKQPSQIWLSRVLMGLGAIGSAFFNVLVGLHERLPHLFDENPTWPTSGQWVVHGGVSAVEGVIIPGAALLVSLLLHSMTSHRLIEADGEEARVQMRREMKPYSCPFCTSSFDSKSKLYGHTARCDAMKTSDLTDVERKAIIQKAVAEGDDRIVRG